MGGYGTCGYISLTYSGSVWPNNNLIMPLRQVDVIVSDDSKGPDAYKRDQLILPHAKRVHCEASF